MDNTHPSRHCLYPALAAVFLGWLDGEYGLCGHEGVIQEIQRCIRSVLLHPRRGGNCKLGCVYPHTVPGLQGGEEPVTQGLGAPAPLPLPLPLSPPHRPAATPSQGAIHWLSHPSHTHRRPRPWQAPSPTDSPWARDRL